MGDSNDKKAGAVKGTTRQPWYAEGLRFECQPDCAACCTNHDDYSYVYLEGDDLERISEHLEISADECAERYTIVEDDCRVLRMDLPDCPFLHQVGERRNGDDVAPLRGRLNLNWANTHKGHIGRPRLI